MQTGSLTAAAVSAIRSACHAGTGSRELPEDFYTGGLKTLRYEATKGGHDLADAMVLLVGIAAVTRDLDGFLRAAFLDMDVNPESTALDSVRRVLTAHLARTNPE